MADLDDVRPTLERVAGDRELEARWQATTGRLRTALAELVPLSTALRHTVAAQSSDYRGGAAPRLTEREDVEAYAASRMPATFAAVGAAMRETARAVPSLAPVSLLDVGTGTGSASWAATSVWPGLSQVTGIDRSALMLGLARELASRSGAASLESANWARGAATTAALQPADLVAATYLLGEIPDRPRENLIETLWAATQGVLVVVEPGTPEGFARIRSARRQLIAAGALVAAPCPHDQACPMVDRDWCHFAARLGRSRLHRQAKGVEVPWEDEPYSYVAASRLPVERSARVLARPAVRKGAIGLRLCTLDGIRPVTVSRRDRPAYRAARHLGWGSRFETWED